LADQSSFGQQACHRNHRADRVAVPQFKPPRMLSGTAKARSTWTGLRRKVHWCSLRAPGTEEPDTLSSLEAMAPSFLVESGRYTTVWPAAGTMFRSWRTGTPPKAPPTLAGRSHPGNPAATCALNLPRGRQRYRRNAIHDRRPPTHQMYSGKIAHPYSPSERYRSMAAYLSQQTARITMASRVGVPSRNIVLPRRIAPHLTSSTGRALTADL
jgi:hypothetical protein